MSNSIRESVRHGLRHDLYGNLGNRFQNILNDLMKTLEQERLLTTEIQEAVTRVQTLLTQIHNMCIEATGINSMSEIVFTQYVRETLSRVRYIEMQLPKMCYMLIALLDSAHFKHHPVILRTKARFELYLKDSQVFEAVIHILSSSLQALSTS